MAGSRYSFDESVWAPAGSGIDYDQSEEVLSEVNQLQQLYPEIRQWCDLALFNAWGSFSQDHHNLNWYPVLQRNETFLAYLYHVQQGHNSMAWNEQEAQRIVEKLFA